MYGELHFVLVSVASATPVCNASSPLPSRVEFGEVAGVQILMSSGTFRHPTCRTQQHRLRVLARCEEHFSIKVLFMKMLPRG
jgi:hypothetical protein